MEEHHLLSDPEELARSFEEAPAEVPLGELGPEDWLTFTFFWLMTAAVFTQFFSRYVLNDSTAWTEEIAIYLLLSVVFFGGAMCIRLDRHIQVDFLYRYLPRPVGRILATLVDLIRIALMAYLAVLVWRFLQLVQLEIMTSVELPKSIPYFCVFLGVVTMLVRAILGAWTNWRRGYSILERPEAFQHDHLPTAATARP